MMRSGASAAQHRRRSTISARIAGISRRARRLAAARAALRWRAALHRRARGGTNCLAMADEPTPIEADEKQDAPADEEAASGAPPAAEAPAPAAAEAAPEPPPAAAPEHAAEAPPEPEAATAE